MTEEFRNRHEQVAVFQGPVTDALALTTGGCWEPI